MAAYNTTRQVTIPSGSALSNQIDLGGYHLVGIKMPADWTAAVITFHATVDGDATPYPAYDEAGSEITVQASDDRHILLDLARYYGLRVFQIRSGTNGSPVNQGADRVITLLLAA